MSKAQATTTLALLVEATDRAKRNVLAASVDLRRTFDALRDAVQAEIRIIEKRIDAIEEGGPDWPDGMTDAEFEKISDSYKRTMAPERRRLQRQLQKLEDSHIPSGEDVNDAIRGIIKDDCQVSLLALLP